MSGCCGGGARPKFTQLDPSSFRRTLGAGLRNCVDKVRDLNTVLGLRPYVVRVVRAKWSGGRRGAGEMMEVSVTPLLPTPKLATMEGVQLDVRSFGKVEVGAVVLSEVSGTYTENQLQGRLAGEVELPVDVSSWIEIEYIGDNMEGRLRRFVADSLPDYDAGMFQWTVRLATQDPDRKRGGIGEIR